MQISIDWTASLEKEENRGQDPWLSLKTMRPDKHLPQAPLTDYKGTKYDVFTMYLPRRGIAPCEHVRAYASGHFKMIECRGRLYLTMIDGIMYERNIELGFNSKKELSRYTEIM